MRIAECGLKVKIFFCLGMLLLFCRTKWVYGKDQWKITFEGYQEGKIPSGFTALSGVWTTKKEPAPSGQNNHFLYQQEVQQDIAKTAVVLFNEGKNLKNISTQVRIKIEKNSKKQTAGLLVKYQNSANYVFLAIGASEGTVYLAKVNAGRASIITKINANLGVDQWHRLQVSVRDRFLSCSLNGIKLFQSEDRSLDLSSPIGFVTVGDTLASFDNFSIVPTR